jgi:predicted  nucleic acid-binding Zn-ribbon protein
VQMKDYQTARRKLESRRLTYDSVLSKVQKMKKEDVRIEEELRSARAKYEETNEDVHNRMTAIQDAEVHPPPFPSLFVYN